MRILLTTITTLLLAAAPAAAAQRVTGVGATYDYSAGSVTATISLAGTGSAGSGLFALVGTKAADGDCTEFDSVQLSAAATSDGVLDPTFEQYVPGTSFAVASGPATRSEGAGTVTLTATDPRLAGRGYNCVFTTVAADDDDATVSQLASPLAVVNVPAGVAGGGAAGAGSGVLGASGSSTPGQASKRAKLRITLKGVPKRLRRGGAVTVRVVVRNIGTKQSPKATLRLKRTRGVTTKPAELKVKALAPGKAATLKVRVTLGRKARASTRLAFTVKGSGVSATARRTVKTRPAKRR